jgi:hypothetical protein
LLTPDQDFRMPARRALLALAAAPNLLPGHLIALPNKDGTVYAVHAHSGRPAWRHRLADSGARSAATRAGTAQNSRSRPRQVRQVRRWGRAA